MMEGSGAAAALSIMILSLISEDAAVIGGAVLAAAGGIPWTVAFFAAFAGVWIGDLGLYAAARIWGRRAVAHLLRRQRRGADLLARSEMWFRRYGWLALVLCRMIPATRLPTYLAAGLLKMPAGRFVLLTGALALAWVSVVFELVKLAGKSAPIVLEKGLPAQTVAAIGLLGIVVLWCKWRRIPAWLNSRDLRARIREWEFWPAWIFYLPVAVWYLLLALRHRSMALPTCANPGMFTGGMIGESKIATLRELQESSPQWVAAGFPVPTGELVERFETLSSGLAAHGISFPIVLKPDVGQRGSGFQLVRSESAARDALSAIREPLIAQEYLPGPLEAGIFYVRFPDENRGRIFSITKKVFPDVTGDGVRTLENLILADARARRMARVYLRRLGEVRHRVPAQGEKVKLVHAGNHAQGCMFQSGDEWCTEELERRIDDISRKLNGFFIGRYDVRFSDPEELRRGRGFRILELNGAASEATSAYDARHSVFRAYSILFEQWRLVFAVGAANRRRGVLPTPWTVLLREWWNYRKKSRNRPMAD